MTLMGYPRSGTVLRFKGQGHRVNKCIYHTNVRSITQKRMIPKCSNLVYPRSDTVLGFKGQR